MEPSVEGPVEILGHMCFGVIRAHLKFPSCAVRSHGKASRGAGGPGK